MLHITPKLIDVLNMQYKISNYKMIYLKEHVHSLGILKTHLK